MPRNRNRHQLQSVSADGTVTVFGNLEPPPSKILQFLPQWIRWLADAYKYLGSINENFLTIEDWHEVDATGEPAFENAWAVYLTNTVKFYKDPFGIVRLRGRVDTAGVTGTVVFTLPTGYRPDATYTQLLAYDSITTTDTARGYIGTNGEVVIVNPGTTWTALDGITFRV